MIGTLRRDEEDCTHQQCRGCAHEGRQFDRCLRRQSALWCDQRFVKFRYDHADSESKDPDRRRDRFGDRPERVQGDPEPRDGLEQATDYGSCRVRAAEGCVFPGKVFERPMQRRNPDRNNQDCCDMPPFSPLSQSENDKDRDDWRCDRCSARMYEQQSSRE